MTTSTLISKRFGSVTIAAIEENGRYFIESSIKGKGDIIDSKTHRYSMKCRENALKFVEEATIETAKKAKEKLIESDPVVTELLAAFDRFARGCVEINKHNLITNKYPSLRNKR